MIGDSVIYEDGQPAPGVVLDLFGATVDLVRTDYVASTATDDDGIYGFTDDAGCYVVVAIAPDGQTFVDGGQWSEQGTCLTAGETDDTLDAVLARPTTAAIGDSVTNSDGSAAPGVAIDLFAANDDGSRAGYLRSTASSEGGGYGFDVSPGCYVVVFIAPEGRVFTNGSPWNQQFLCLAAGETNNGIDAVLS